MSGARTTVGALADEQATRWWCLASVVDQPAGPVTAVESPESLSDQDLLRRGPGAADLVADVSRDPATLATQLGDVTEPVLVDV